jgi:DNA-directed RNA polymerase specialized sigma24 family protein
MVHLQPAEPVTPATPHGRRDGYTSSPVCHRRHQTIPEDRVTAVAQVPREVREADLLRAAFRDLHGSSLHGFALLVALGDRRRAEDAAAATLAEGARRAGALRHPERAAAWLRARALRALRRPRIAGRAPSRAQREATLRALGASDQAIAGLAALSLDERAALVVSGIERLDAIDLETVLGRSRHAVRRLVYAARRRYLATIEQAGALPDTGRRGLLAARIAATAGRALGAGEDAR